MIRVHKYQKWEVDYTSHAHDPNEKCSLCEHYFINHKCEIVGGAIDPGGWCNKFKRKGERKAA